MVKLRNINDFKKNIGAMGGRKLLVSCH